MMKPSQNYRCKSTIKDNLAKNIGGVEIEDLLPIQLGILAKALIKCLGEIETLMTQVKKALGAFLFELKSFMRQREEGQFIECLKFEQQRLL